MGDRLGKPQCSLTVTSVRSLPGVGECTGESHSTGLGTHSGNKKKIACDMFLNLPTKIATRTTGAKRFYFVTIK